MVVNAISESLWCENVAAGDRGAADVVNAISGEFVGGGIVVWAEGGKVVLPLG